MSPVGLPEDVHFQADLPLWSIDQSAMKLSREFVFKDFKQAFAFMTLCAQYAEEIDHHPDWANSWNRVQVSLTTHSAKALTQLDIQLAKAMDDFALQVQA